MNHPIQLLPKARRQPGCPGTLARLSFLNALRLDEWPHTPFPAFHRRLQFNGKNDYINANWINGQANKNVYIAAQGPVPASFPAFWQMVWEKDVMFLVMVTNEVEGGKLKCHRYWPTQQEGTVRASTHASTSPCARFVHAFRHAILLSTVRTFPHPSTLPAWSPRSAPALQVSFGVVTLSLTYVEVHATYVSRHFSLSNVKTGEVR